MKRFLEILLWGVVGLVGIPVFGVVIYTVLAGVGGGSDKQTTDGDIEAAQAADISPSGELPRVFSFLSGATDIQRSDLGRRIEGKIVQWRLPVYDVSERSGVFVIQTKSRNDLVGTFCNVRAGNEAIKKYLLSLKENDYVICKGKIAGTTMRSINIKPAILVR